jgi:Cu-Zn family superoxide dismutase
MSRTSNRVIAGVLAGAFIAVPIVAAGAEPTHRPTVGAVLRLADGTDIGRVRFSPEVGATVVSVSLSVPADTTSVRSFHGFHIHANDNPANGDGCLADPAAASSTWFVSADGHLRAGTETHASHVGDMPSLHLNTDGTASARFSIDRIAPADLSGRAVIVHAGADNFGNVPVGPNADQYTPNSQTAIDRTQATGNAGDRIACGLITDRR